MLRVVNHTAFSCCHQFVNHCVYNPMMLSGWYACRVAVIYGSTYIREASGNHQKRKDLQSKCIALTWPLSHPKPFVETEKTGTQDILRASAFGPSELLSLIDRRTGRKDGLVFLLTR